ncbi:MAG TPA: maltose alpha-D-glucosyltransferase [Candidatus Dormibacteraeota bacterium]
MRSSKRRKTETYQLDDDPLWYKDAIIYEVHVRAFNDSDGDGGGDFKGLIEKLPYLQELGVNAIWLLPFYPSPLRDDGYDIADYEDVNPMYGRLADVRKFIAESHRRGMRVITELVCNHTSDQHPWFQKARRARPGSAMREMYVWSETNQKYQDTRIIFKDFEVSNWTWDHVANAYYWHRFFSHQPDLNYDNPRVKEALFKVCDFWLDMGIDGMRLDAVPYLYEREGTNSENLPETHGFLKELRKHIDDGYRNRMLLSEANQWPEDAVAYFGQGDECNMGFHFPLMPRLFMSIRMEDRFPIIDILAQTPAIPDTSQWALFLRNHDELTLEMVTDEERDYMYRAYTQDRAARINLGIRRRLAPLLGNERRRIELMNGLLFSLPGTPVIYYGDEIGMGDNIFLGDRNGVRTPMQWSGDRNAGFSDANRQRLYLPVITDPEYHYETVNVETQHQNPHSLLSWMKRVIALRKRHRAFGRGTLELLRPENRKILAFVRRYESEQILVIANLSRFLQTVELDLSAWKGMVPLELFGSTELPVIGDAPYFLTLGPHSFFWFSLQPRATAQVPGDGQAPAATLPEIKVSSDWESVFVGRARERLETVLLGYIKQRRWFAGKARRLKAALIKDVINVPGVDGSAYLVTVVVSYAEGDPDTYLVPMAYASGAESPQILERWPHAAIAWLRSVDSDQRGLLYDALGPPEFTEGMLDTIARRRRATSPGGTLVGSTTKAFARLRGPETIRLEAALSVTEQTNNSVVFGDRLILKISRRLEEGLNPELEVGRFLTEKTSFSQIAPIAGSLEFRRAKAEPLTLAILQGYVPNQGDAWQYTLTTLAHFLTGGEVVSTDAPPRIRRSLAQAIANDLPEVATRTVGAYLESARLLGQRTAELHAALASDPDDPAFAPERISQQDQRSIYQSLNGVALRSMELLRSQLKRLPENARDEARQVLELEPRIMSALRAFLGRRLTTTRIRVHGDYHLGQVLYTGSDFVIIDFEGEPTRSLYERRLKRLALRDVAGMLRSFHYASQTALNSENIPAESTERSQAWSRLWVDSVSATFLRSYMSTAGTASFIPHGADDLEMQLKTMLLEKALYELRYELNTRPDWVGIPLRGILDLMAPA